MRQFISDHMSFFERSIKMLGGTWDEVMIDDPATEQELIRIETTLGQALPAGLRQFALTVSRRIEFHWYLPEDYELPEPFRDIFSGGLDYDVSKIPEHEQGRAGWERECFPDPDDPYDLVWHNKLGFHHVPNGDYLGFDLQGRVVYLSHDDGEGHGYVMASSFVDLLERWIPLGCPGPEDWQWLPFVSGATSGILPNSAKANEWLRIIQNGP
jgi:hypothetical protein